jgi:hypothetical protein
LCSTGLMTCVNASARQRVCVCVCVCMCVCVCVCCVGLETTSSEPSLHDGSSDTQQCSLFFNKEKYADLYIP